MSQINRLSKFTNKIGSNISLIPKIIENWYFNYFKSGFKWAQNPQSDRPTVSCVMYDKRFLKNF